MIASNGHPAADHPSRPLRLLSAFLAHSCDPAAFAAAENLSATDLLDWSANPAIQAHLSDLKRLTDQSLAIRTAQARIAALSTLEAVARSSDDPLERRRAAASILRNTIPVRRAANVPSLAARSDRCDAPERTPVSIADLNANLNADLSDNSEAEHTAPRSRPAPTTTLGEPIPPLYAHAPLRFAPNPALTPEHIAHTVALALYTHRDPACSAAIAAYLAPGATIANQPAPTNPRDLANLDHLAPRAASVHHQHFRSASTSDSSTHTLVLMHARLPSSHYSLTLTRSSSGPHPNCWLIANLTRTTDTS